MSILSIASNASAWRGYEYYIDKRVHSCKQTGENEFQGIVSGSGNNTYKVIIDISHPKRSVCNCPHAEGKRKICKHKVAVFFTAFPKEAEEYIAEIEEGEREEEEREQEHYDQIVRYVKTLSKEELRVELINAMMELEESDRYRY